MAQSTGMLPHAGPALRSELVTASLPTPAPHSCSSAFPRGAPRLAALRAPPPQRGACAPPGGAGPSRCPCLGRNVSPERRAAEPGPRRSAERRRRPLRWAPHRRRPPSRGAPSGRGLAATARKLPCRPVTAPETAAGAGTLARFAGSRVPTRGSARAPAPPGRPWAPGRAEGPLRRGNLRALHARAPRSRLGGCGGAPRAPGSPAPAPGRAGTRFSRPAPPAGRPAPAASGLRP